jgi:hypothetical protein
MEFENSWHRYTTKSFLNRRCWIHDFNEHLRRNYTMTLLHQGLVFWTLSPRTRYNETITLVYEVLFLIFGRGQN